MAMAAVIESRTAKAPTRSKASRIAAVDILSDLGKAEAIWRSLEDTRQFATPYQRFDFLSASQRQVGEREAQLDARQHAREGRGDGQLNHQDHQVLLEHVRSWALASL